MKKLCNLKMNTIEFILFNFEWLQKSSMNASMEEIREQAMTEVLEALPTVQDSVLSCVGMFTDETDDFSKNKLQTITSLIVKNECGDDLNHINIEFSKRKEDSKKENINNTVLVDVLVNVMRDGIQLFDDEECAALAIKNTQ